MTLDKFLLDSKQRLQEIRSAQIFDSATCAGLRRSVFFLISTRILPGIQGVSLTLCLTLHFNRIVRLSLVFGVMCGRMYLLRYTSFECC